MLQFCWLSPDKRATAEEVHRLLTYLRMQGQKDIEEDFEQRWDALKPNPTTRQTTVSHSSFPILDQFAHDALRQEIDEVLTVTETSKGLSFEYVWEAAKQDHYEGNHSRSGLDTTLNYHSMFFPVSREDIQAHFPDPEQRAAGKEDTTSGLPGIVPVFDAQKPMDTSDYYIQLEEQGESRGEGGRQCFSTGRQDFVVLQDVRLDESSTDADFFHQSIDSKDSYLPDSHIWSSLENDSPYHTNIFTEGEQKQDDSPSWRTGFVELPERNGNSFHEGMPFDGQDLDTFKDNGDSFLGDCSEARHLPDTLGMKGEKMDMRQLLNTDKLEDNFMFLQDKNLIKDRTSFPSPQDNFLLPGLAHEPEDTFKMHSWDDLDTLSSLQTAETYLRPVASSISSAEERVHPPSASLVELSQPQVGNEPVVPSITVVTDDNLSIQLPVRNSSSTDDFGLTQSTERGQDSGFDSTSERFEVTISGPVDSNAPTMSESAVSDFLWTDATIPSLENNLETSPDKNSHSFELPNFSVDNGDGQDQTSNNLFSELIEEADLDLENTLYDHEESLLDIDCPTVRSSLLVSGPSLDQISQDSLLEDSASTNLPTVDNSAETPDSLDSLDIHRLDEQTEELSTQVAQHKLQPPYKISDSGYETENLESPEWNSQPGVGDPVKSGPGAARGEGEKADDTMPASNLVPPEIVISEAEVALNAPSGDQDEDLEPAQVAEEPLMGSNYRDSAYFSDNESEPEKKPEDNAQETPGEDAWMRNSDHGGAQALRPDLERDIDSLFSLPELSSAAEQQRSESSDPRPEETLSETMESSAEGVGPDSSHIKVGTAEVLSQPDLLIDLDLPISPPAPPANQTAESYGHAKLTRTFANDGQKIKEPDVEGRYLGRKESPGLNRPEDGADADEEDENSEDSDDEVHAYQLRSSSEDSEDDTVHPVPVIISEDSSGKNLKSLLKPTSLNLSTATSAGSSQAGANGSRRAVSFFDDVTVFLFDQVTETPPPSSFPKQSPLTILALFARKHPPLLAANSSSILIYVLLHVQPLI